MQPVEWTERKFFFGYDKAYAPFFMERLRSTAPRLEEILQNCKESQASVRLNGKWSIKEHIGHLTDLEKLHDGRINDYCAKLDTLRAADMTNRETVEADHNNTSVSRLLASFREVRAQYLQRLEGIDETLFDAKALHPRLKQVVTLTDLLHFQSEHDTHHLVRIAMLLNEDD